MNKKLLGIGLLAVLLAGIGWVGAAQAKPAGCDCNPCTCNPCNCGPSCPCNG